VKLFDITGIVKAINNTPDTAHAAPTTYPYGVTGCTSPYPTVVIVIKAHQNPMGIVGKCSLGVFSLQSESQDTLSLPSHGEEDAIETTVIDEHRKPSNGSVVLETYMNGTTVLRKISYKKKQQKYSPMGFIAESNSMSNIPSKTNYTAVTYFYFKMEHAYHS
jgi:hypothetical protein